MRGTNIRTRISNQRFHKLLCPTWLQRKEWHGLELYNTFSIKRAVQEDFVAVIRTIDDDVACYTMDGQRLPSSFRYEGIRVSAFGVAVKEGSKINPT